MRTLRRSVNLLPSDFSKHLNGSHKNFSLPYRDIGYSQPSEVPAASYVWSQTRAGFAFVSILVLMVFCLILFTTTLHILQEKLRTHTLLSQKITSITSLLFYEKPFTWSANQVSSDGRRKLFDEIYWDVSQEGFILDLPAFQHDMELDKLQIYAPRFLRKPISAGIPHIQALSSTGSATIPFIDLPIQFFSVAIGPASDTPIPIVTETPMNRTAYPIEWDGTATLPQSKYIYFFSSTLPRTHFSGKGFVIPPPPPVSQWFEWEAIRDLDSSQCNGTPLLLGITENEAYSEQIHLLFRDDSLQVYRVDLSEFVLCPGAPPLYKGVPILSPRTGSLEWNDFNFIILSMDSLILIDGEPEICPEYTHTLVNLNIIVKPEEPFTLVLSRHEEPNPSISLTRLTVVHHGALTIKSETSPSSFTGDLIHSGTTLFLLDGNSMFNLTGNLYIDGPIHGLNILKRRPHPLPLPSSPPCGIRHWMVQASLLVPDMMTSDAS